MKRLNPLLLVPGTVFWGCLIAGFVTGNTTFFTVAVSVAILLIGSTIYFAAKASAARRARMRRVWHEGEPATARVVSIRTGGGSVNDHPYVDFVLELPEPDAPPRRVEVTALISQLAIPRIQPGCTIAVRVDRGDPSVVVVDVELTPYGY